ncbi:MAG: hypothetical protein EXS30_03045 [Pedosphaera sp.]|nr:hypothetical protein [Pedosphaera sp.]
MRIFYSGTVSENLLRLRSLAECFGIETTLVDVRAHQSLTAALKKVMAQGDASLVLDAESLKDGSNLDELDEVAGLLGSCDATVLLFATGDHELTNRFLRTLTGGAVHEVNRTACATSIRFPVSGSRLSGELASQTYPRQSKEALTLTVAHGGGTDLIMELDASPSFAHFRSGRARIFVWSTASVFDVHRRLEAEKEFEVASDEYIPAIIFLRSAYREHCWHNPRVGAGIIIDDPLLKKRYGFIHFPELLASARKHSYHVTLAFIPWNHWRSRSKAVKMFLEHSDCFSICAHGCDHTRNEFRSDDYESLLRKNFVARRRMQRHRERTGLGFEPLMVCPQEQYSLEAMRAFSDSRQFLGLVNTACMPRNLTANQPCGADLLLPAQDSFFGFPVFKRHYWKDMSVFAMGLFLGKPAILVEHHEFFRDGPAGAEEFVSRLAEMRPAVKWTPLSETVTRTHLRRRLPNGNREVRFFTDTFHLEHEVERATEYRLIRRVPATTAVRHVTVNGNVAPFTRENGLLTCYVRVERPQSLEVRVVVMPVEPTKAYSSGLTYCASVAVRRGFSELRDNVLARNRFALKAGKSLTKAWNHACGK